MKVKELIEKLQKIENQELNVYINDNELDEDTYFYQLYDVRELNVEEEEICSLMFRN
jgi:hypothetical protein